MNLISPPDFIENENIKLLLVNTLVPVIELTIAACRMLDYDVDIYVCTDTADPAWFGKVAMSGAKIFKSASFADIQQYLRECSDKFDNAAH